MAQRVLIASSLPSKERDAREGAHSPLLAQEAFLILTLLSTKSLPRTPAALCPFAHSARPCAPYLTVSSIRVFPLLESKLLESEIPTGSTVYTPQSIHTWQVSNKKVLVRG